jgi:hypothetical protein
VRQLGALAWACSAPELAQEDEEHDLTVRVAHHEAPQPLIDQLQQGAPQLFEARDVSIVREHPAPVLKRVTIEHGLVALGGLAHVGQHRLGSHHAAQPVEQRVAQRRARAAGHVRRAVDVERHTPTIGVVVALHSQGVLGRQKGAMDLAGDHTTEAEETAHGSQGA